jgi:hypothetical protein
VLSSHDCVENSHKDKVPKILHMYKMAIESARIE